MKSRPAQWMLALIVALAAHLALAHWIRSPAPPPAEKPGIRIGLGTAGLSGDGATRGTGMPTVGSPARSTRIAAVAEMGAPLQPVTGLQTATITALAVAQPLAGAIRIEAIERQEPPPKTGHAPPARPKPGPKLKTQPTSPTAASAQSATRTARPQVPRDPEPVAAGPDIGSGRPTGQVAGGAPDQPGGGKGTAGRAAGTGLSGGAGAGAGGHGGTPGGKTQAGKSKERYYSELAAWLDRHKRYPQRARQLRQEGTVRVRFVIDGSGRLISQRIESSSGHAALDEAASELLRRAAPLPAIPPSMRQSRLEIVIPIAYRLR